jgi:GGDEF domain-containing protein
MIKPGYLDRICAITAVVAAILIAIFQIPSGFNSLRDFLFEPISIQMIGLILSVFAPPLITFYLLNTVIYRQKEEHQTTLMRLENSEKALDDTRRLIHTDIITGVPNQLKWKEDLRKISSRSNAQNFYILLIDLEKFGEINEKYGFSKGDEIIRLIASRIYESMRRNEEIYKNNPAAGVVGKHLLGGMYRRYSAGDEFLFVIEGSEDEALGFLLRQDRLIQQLQPDFEKILGEPRSFRFYAALDKVLQGDNDKTILSRLEPMYQKAKEHYRNLRIYFPALTDPDEAAKLSNYNRVLQAFKL